MENNPQEKEMTSPCSQNILGKIHVLLKNTLLHRKKKDKQNLRSEINRSPVVVLGNQRSGTSAIAHLLADYAGLTKTVDIPEIFWPTVGRLMNGEQTLTEFADKNRSRFSSDLIKEPNLTFFVEQLKELCPEARFVFVVRDPRDNIRSILNRMGLPGNLQVLKIKEMRLARPIKKYWLYLLDATMINADTEHYIQTLAVRWNRMVGVYLRYQAEIILIRYEDFNLDKTGTIRKTAGKLGLSESINIADRVDIHYQPPGNGNIAWLDFFGVINLGYIDEICGSEMTEFGYLPGTSG